MVVVGTVKGDIHDIGKDLVVSLLKANGYQVIDLGVDVPAAAFVEAVQANKAPVVGLSGLLTISFDAMKDTVAALEAAGLRPGVKVMIGGGPVTEQVRPVCRGGCGGRRRPGGGDPGQRLDRSKGGGIMDNVALMEERLARIRKVVKLEPVDRLPVIQNASAFGPRYTGHTIAEFCARQ